MAISLTSTNSSGAIQVNGQDVITTNASGEVTARINGTLQTIPNAINTTVPTILNATGSAPVYACRAWVSFSGTGTVAIRASGNVSSITDNGTGNYTVNFTNAMPDTNYAVMITIGASSVSSPYAPQYVITSKTTTSFNVGVFGFDPDELSIAVIR